MILRTRIGPDPKNHSLDDSGSQTIPRKQIHGEIPSEADFFAPNSNFSKSRNLYLIPRRGFLVWVPGRDSVSSTGRLQLRVHVHVAPRVLNGFLSAWVLWKVWNFPSLTTQSAPGTHRRFTLGRETITCHQRGVPIRGIF